MKGTLVRNANAGIDSSTPDFTMGTSQSYTVYVDAPSTTTQTVTLTLSGVPASDFGIATGTGVVALGSGGTFTVTIAAGQTSAAFTLVNTGDVGKAATMTLSASMTNPGDSSGQAISSETLTQSYVEPSSDPFLDNATSTVTGTSEKDPNDPGFSYNLYTGGTSAGQSEQMALSGGDNFVVGRNENEFITKGEPGNNIILGSSASSNDILLNGAGTVAQAIALAGTDTTASGQGTEVRVVTKRSRGAINGGRLWLVFRHRLSSRHGKSARLMTVTASVLIAILVSAMPSRKSYAQEAGILHASYQFRLTWCDGDPVCKAFLKRLRATKFTAPPYCGIPENDSVPGFAPLNRVPLSESEIVALFPKVFSFTFKRNQYIVPPQSSTSEIKRYIRYGMVRAWGYSPEISVNNDGKTNNVVVWQGAGIYYSSAFSTQCGEIFRVNDPPGGAQTPQIALVLAHGGYSIDQKSTTKLLGNPWSVMPYIKQYQEENGVAAFSPLGYEMGFVKYDDVYYLYAFSGATPNSRMKQQICTRGSKLFLYVRRDSKFRVIGRYCVTSISIIKNKGTVR